jgi:hypothetical protein
MPTGEPCEQPTPTGNHRLPLTNRDWLIAASTVGNAHNALLPQLLQTLPSVGSSQTAQKWPHESQVK